MATTGTLVVWRMRRASSKPIPLDAGVTSAHGCMATTAKEGRVEGGHSDLLCKRCWYARYGAVEPMMHLDGDVSAGSADSLHFLFFVFAYLFEFSLEAT